MKRIVKLFTVFTFLLLTKQNFATSGDTLFINPNPFDSVTVIQFNIVNNDTVWLDVFDTWGQTVKNYYTAVVLPSGSYSVTFNADTLPNGQYFVRLKINSTMLIKKVIKNDNAVGVKENSKDKIYPLFFPNPTSSVLEIPINGLKKIIVTNLQGKLVLECITSEKSISLSELTIGNYIVTVFSENNQLLSTQKIIKTK